MTDIVVIRLDGEPVGKGRPRFGNGRAFTPAKTKAHEAALRYAAQQAMGNRPPFEGAVALQIQALMPIPKSTSKAARLRCISGETRPTKKPDLDNIAKIVGDALNEVVWKDDVQIVRLLASKKFSEKPGLMIFVEPIVGSEA